MPKLKSFKIVKKAEGLGLGLDPEVKPEKLSSVSEYTKKKYIQEVGSYETKIKKLEKSIANHNDQLKDKEKSLEIAKNELAELNKLGFLIL
jgi:endonuclease III-like uncharacterized protein